MPSVVANGAKISYQQAGEGPDVVLIHGLATNRAFWFPHPLQSLKEHCRVTIFDLRGHGYSSMPESGYTSADMADDLAVLMDHLSIEAAVLVGHSFGGVVGLQYATRHPDRVKGLVLADSRVLSLQPIQSLDQQAELQGLEKELISQSVDNWQKEPHVGMRLLEELARHKLNNPGQPSRKGINPFGGMGKGERSARLWLKLLETTSAREDIRSPAGLTAGRIKAFGNPIALIYGERSRCIDTCRQMEQQLPHSDTIIVPGVGHFHPIARPRYFTNAVLDFIERAEASESGPGSTDGSGASDADRRQNSRQGNWNGQTCRRRRERRVAWRKRGWKGAERRKRPRDPGLSWMEKGLAKKLRDSETVIDNSEEKRKWHRTSMKT